MPSYLKRRLIAGEPIESKSESKEMVILSADERLHLIQSMTVRNVFFSNDTQTVFSIESFRLDLKLRYETVFAEYQRLPLRPETTSTLIKQTYLTEELVHLERDIKFLEKHKQIFVVEQYADMRT